MQVSSINSITSIVPVEYYVLDSEMRCLSDLDPLRLSYHSYDEDTLRAIISVVNTVLNIVYHEDIQGVRNFKFFGELIENSSINDSTNKISGTINKISHTITELLMSRTESKIQFISEYLQRFRGINCNLSYERLKNQLIIELSWKTSPKPIYQPPLMWNFWEYHCDLKHNIMKIFQSDMQREIEINVGGESIKVDRLTLGFCKYFNKLLNEENQAYEIANRNDKNNEGWKGGGYYHTCNVHRQYFDDNYLKEHQSQYNFKQFSPDIFKKYYYYLSNFETLHNDKTLKNYFIYGVKDEYFHDIYNCLEMLKFSILVDYPFLKHISIKQIYELIKIDNFLAIEKVQLELNNPDLEKLCTWFRNTNPVYVSKTISAAKHPLYEYFSKYLGKAALSDIKINAGGTFIDAHQIILSQVPYFETMFSGKWKETHEGILNLPNCSFKTFLCLLNYLYKGELQDEYFDDLHNCIEMLAFTIQIDYKPLRDHSNSKIFEFMNPENYLQILVLQKKLGDEDLEKLCKHFAITHQNFGENLDLSSLNEKDLTTTYELAIENKLSKLVISSTEEVSVRQRKRKIEFNTEELPPEKKSRTE